MSSCRHQDRAHRRYEEQVARSHPLLLPPNTCEVTALPDTGPVASKARVGLGVLGSPWPQTTAQYQAPRHAPTALAPAKSTPAVPTLSPAVPRQARRLSLRPLSTHRARPRQSSAWDMRERRTRQPQTELLFLGSPRTEGETQSLPCGYPLKEKEKKKWILEATSPKMEADP